MRSTGLENSSTGDPSHAPHAETNSASTIGDGWQLASGNRKPKGHKGGDNSPPSVSVGELTPTLSTLDRRRQTGSTSPAIRSTTDMEVDSTPSRTQTGPFLGAVSMLNEERFNTFSEIHGVFTGVCLSRLDLGEEIVGSSFSVTSIAIVSGQ